MKKIGITGSLASGKTTASKIISAKKGPLFNADYVVKKIYAKKSFKQLISKKFNLSNNSNLKKNLKIKILENKKNLIILEKLIHPKVRKEMKKFIKKNKGKKFLFFEIPLLIESKLMKNFDVIIFIKAKKSLRLKRFKSKGNNKKLFKLLDNKQIGEDKKMKLCDHVIVNEKNLKFLKIKLLAILEKYE